MVVNYEAAKPINAFVWQTNNEAMITIADQTAKIANMMVAVETNAWAWGGCHDS